MSDYIGLKLGNYRILGLIGRGGFARVYLGEHIYLKTPAAIKVLNMQLMHNGLENFLAEARTIALLEHPQIVRILEFGIEGITPFLVMNYAEHGTIREHYPPNTPLSQATIISYTRQVADALQYAHDCGVIHRDIKPENMLLGKNHHIQLSDFGLALLIQNIQQHPSGGAGTTAYMAPEQLQGHPCPASDQYALGVVIYEWLSGKRPFIGSEREVTLQHLYTSPSSAHIQTAGVSPAVEQVIMKALAKNPQERFASIHEFAQVLEQALVSSPILNTAKGNVISPGHLSHIPGTPLPQINALSSEQSSFPWQERIRASSSLAFSPQLPLLIHEAPPLPMNEGRILQPSLGSSIYSLEGASAPFDSSFEDTANQLSVSASSLPRDTPLAQKFPDMVAPPQPQTQVQSLPQKKLHMSRHSPLTALVGMAIIGLTILGGLFIWTQFAPYTPRFSSLQHNSSSTTVHTNTPISAKTLQRGSLTPNTHHSRPTLVPSPHVGPQSSTTPVPVTTPTPLPVATSQPTPRPTSQPTPTPNVPLTITIVSAPPSAIAGSTITIVTQASKGGVTVALDGKVRFFGQKIANSQGIATFAITTPAQGKRILLTATTTGTNGVQVLSPSVLITIKK